MYRWVGWFDGRSDCEPPEPGKFWIEIQEDMEEIAIIVWRPREQDAEDFDRGIVVEGQIHRELTAQLIVDALNNYPAREVRWAIGE